MSIAETIAKSSHARKSMGENADRVAFQGKELGELLQRKDEFAEAVRTQLNRAWVCEGFELTDAAVEGNAFVLIFRGRNYELQVNGFAVQEGYEVSSFWAEIETQCSCSVS